MTTGTSAAAGPDPAAMLRALFWMSGALVSFLAMGIAGREIAAELEPHHASFYRNAICLLILLPFVWRAGWTPLRTAKPFQHVVRNTVHFGAQWCWLLGVGVLPLAEVFAIEFTSPIWTAIIAALFLGERLNGPRVAAIALGFVGILVMLRPGLALIDPASFVVLAAAIGYATVYVLTKGMIGTESPLTIIWWMSMVQLPIGLAMSITDFRVPSLELWPYAAVLGVGALTSHYSLSRALRLVDATVVAPLDFMRLPLAGLVAWMIYQEPLDPFVLLGALFVLAGNWINLRKG